MKLSWVTLLACLLSPRAVWSFILLLLGKKEITSHLAFAKRICLLVKSENTGSRLASSLGFLLVFLVVVKEVIIRD